VRALLVLAIGLFGCGNPFGTDFGNVCAQYQGRTCIALGLGCEGDRQDVDQFQLVSPIQGLLPGGPVLIPPTPAKMHLPAVVAILPDATFAGGTFTIDISAFAAGVKVITGEQQGSVALGASTRVGADSNNQLCLNQLLPACNGCPFCCVEGRCVQMSQDCDSGSVCSVAMAAAPPQCVACGGVGQPCCQGQTCTDGCCNTNSQAGTCVALSTLCSNGITPLYCLAPNGSTPTCRPCGGPGQTCCPGSACNNQNDCCDPTSGSCQAAGSSCAQANTFCSQKSCTPCGGSNQHCCPTTPGCVSGTCNGGTLMCP
jgi:hypothetical protein